MTELINCLLALGVVTSGAVLMSSITRLIAICWLALYVNKIVTKLRRNLCVTYCTFLTGSTGSCSTLGMTLCRNFSSAYCLTTILTDYGNRTCNSTGSIYGCGSCVGMSARPETINNRVNHCSITITCSFNSYSLSFGCINTNRCVFTVVTKSSDVVTYTVYGNGNSVCLIACYVNNNVQNLIGNGEGNRANRRRRTKLNTNVALNVTSSSINLSGRSKNKVIFTFGICLNRCYIITVCIFFLALGTEVKDQFIGKFSTTVTTNTINIVVSCCGNFISTNNDTARITSCFCSATLSTGCFFSNCCGCIFVSTFCTTALSINNFYFSKSNLSISNTVFGISCIKDCRISVDCYHCT